MREKVSSTTEKGDSFRDLVVRHLRAAGFICTSEVRADHKKGDARVVWSRNDLDGLASYLVEMKDYTQTLPKDECVTFVAEYGTLVRNREAEKAWLISKGPIAPDGRKLVEGNPGLRCFTFEEFQRTLLQVDGYLLDLIASYNDKGIAQYYIPPHTEEGDDLERIVYNWLEDDFPEPLAIISGYGKGKSTFAQHLAAQMAKAAQLDSTKRIPLLIRLGDVMDVVGIDGLVARILTSSHRSVNYHYQIFDELNRAGRFLVILDGFDEMKHGMTISMFERAFMELMRFDEGDARVLILGRDTAFHNDDEFRSVILGRQSTLLGTKIRTSGRRECRTVSLREFTPDEVARYVKAYFALLLQKRKATKEITDEWIEGRISQLLSPKFKDLIVRPVHAQMLCEVATDPDLALASMTKLLLYDTFVHHLLQREVRKAGRDASIPLEVRQGFNAAVAWWLWERKGATTASIDSIPLSLIREAIGELDYDYDTAGLLRELASGLLAEKSQLALYFPHRSIQEFLVAFYLLSRGSLLKVSQHRDPSATLELLNPEIVDFLAAYFEEHIEAHEQAREWIASVDFIRKKLNSTDLILPVRLAVIVGLSDRDYFTSQWMYWIGFFVLNGRPSFDVSSDRAESILNYMAARWVRGPAPEAVLILMAHAVPFTDSMSGQLVATLLGAWLPARELADAVSIASARRNAIAQVRKEESYRLWSFLQTAQVMLDEDEIIVSVDKGRMLWLASEIGTGFIDTSTVQDKTKITCSSQALYRALQLRDVPDSVIEKIRPFFNDSQIRSRVRPLIVERKPKGPKFGILTSN